MSFFPPLTHIFVAQHIFLAYYHPDTYSPSRLEILLRTTGFNLTFWICEDPMINVDAPISSILLS